MNEEIKEKWLAALRSGKYKQGKELLHYKEGEQDKYCCLGILCELAVDAGIVTRKWYPLDSGAGILTRCGYIAIEDGSDWSKSVLPQAVMEWADLPVHQGLSWNLGGFGGQSSLSEMNDADAPFSEIADKIEELG